MSIIVTHNDMDGFLSKELLKVFEKDAITYDVDYTFDYKSLFDHDKTETLFILDFSFKPNEMNKLSEFFQKVVWIDHHECIEDKAYKAINGIRKIGFCGAYLTYQYCVDNYQTNKYNKLTNLVNYVDAYDCWKEDSSLYERACWLNEYFWSIEPSLHKLLCEVNENDFKNAKLLYDASTIKKAKACNEKSYEISININKVQHLFLVMEGVSGSLSFTAKYDKEKHSGMIAYIYLANSKKWQVSVYSEKIDCSKFCKQHGGGGHKGASGFLATTKDMVNLGIF